MVTAFAVLVFEKSSPFAGVSMYRVYVVVVPALEVV
jgi:hypothetical protein